jgi:hypothetical protein
VLTEFSLGFVLQVGAEASLISLQSWTVLTLLFMQLCNCIA